MARGIDELDEILDEIRNRVFLANRLDELDDLLTKWGLEEFVHPHDTVERYTEGKIVVIGATEIKEPVLLGICKEMGISKSRVELCLDYDKAQKYDYRKLRYSSLYSAVLFGAVPHSTIWKGDAGSIIAQLESQSGYPPIKRLVAGEELKITKSNFKRAIQELLDQKIITTDI